MKLSDITASRYKYSVDEIQGEFRYKILTSFLLVAALFSALFALLHDLGINSMTDIHARVDYVYSLLSVLLLLLLRRFRNFYTAITLSFILISYGDFISGLLFVVNDEFRLVWFYMLVFASYMLLGVVTGMIMTFASITAIILCELFADLQLSQNALYTAILGLLTISLITRAYTLQMKSYKAHLRQSNRELRESIIELDVALARAEQANQTKSLFLANMSHEIRTPMNGVLGMVQVMRGTELDDTQKHYLETIERSGSTLLLLIDDLLDIAKIEAGVLEIKNEVFDTMKWVIDIRILAEPLFEGSSVAFVTEVSDDIPPQLIGDPARLLQMAVNLLSNASKFTEQGEVKLSIKGVSLQGKRYKLCLEVSDTGIGIPASKQQDIFDAFEQVTPARTYNRGVGLGLNITKRLAAAMGGSVMVSSCEGEGSCFTIEVELAQLTTATHLPIATLPKGKSKLQLLLVDDDAINRLVVRTLFQQHGHSVVEALNGKEAIDLLQLHHFDAIIMDVHMPVMDGITATREIRALSNQQLARLPIIGLTASVMSNETGDYHAAGMSAVVQKPVVFEMLMETINDALLNSSIKATA